MAPIIKIEARPGCRLYAEFADGVRGELDLSGELRGPMGEPLLDPAYFALVSLDDWGAPVWPNGYDLSLIHI